MKFPNHAGAWLSPWVAAEQAAELTLAQEREPELTVPAAPEADLFADAQSAHGLDEALAPHEERLGEPG